MATLFPWILADARISHFSWQFPDQIPFAMRRQGRVLRLPASPIFRTPGSFWNRARERRVVMGDVGDALGGPKTQHSA